MDKNRLEELEDSIDKLLEQAHDLKVDLEVYKRQGSENKTKEFEKFDVFKHMTGFLNGEIAINCRTEESANRLIDTLYQLGLNWCDNEDEDFIINWDEFKTNTCYSIDGELSYCNIDYYKNEERLKIVVFE